MFGWAGRILRVDLSRGIIVHEPLDENMARLFLGGLGFNLKILFDEFDPERVKSPFDPENIICISPGALGGTLIGGSARLHVSVGYSPVYRTLGDGNSGGAFAPELKYANYDAIVITGKASHLVYLWIEDDHVELRDASRLRGKKVSETRQLLEQELGRVDFQTLTIGPAGENMSAGAIPVTSETRAAAYGSTGAVFGSKNLKAIVVHGSKGVRVARPDDVLQAATEVYRTNLANYTFPKWSKEGSKWLVSVTAPMARRYNIQEQRSFPYEKVDAPEFMAEYGISGRYKACHACYVHCDQLWRVTKGPHAGLAGKGNQNAVIRAFGPLVGNSDYAAILYLSQLCTDLGLCASYTGQAIATAMHWWEDGLLDARDTDGLKLEWGDTAVVAILLHQMANREDFGALLAEGTEKAAAEIAKKRGVPEKTVFDYVMVNKKGRDIQLDPRGAKGVALSLGMEMRACDIMTVEITYTGRTADLEHFRHIGVPDEIATEFLKRETTDPNTFRGKAYGKVFYDDLNALTNALGICQRHTSWEAMSFGVELMAKCFAAVTGVDHSWQDLLKCGERIWNIQQAMHVRFGLRKQDDFLADRLYDNPRAVEPRKGAVLVRADYEKAVEEYYQLRGWTDDSVPTRAKLEELGLHDVAAKLEQLRIT